MLCSVTAASGGVQHWLTVPTQTMEGSRSSGQSRNLGGRAGMSERPVLVKARYRAFAMTHKRWADFGPGWKPQGESAGRKAGGGTRMREGSWFPRRWIGIICARCGQDGVVDDVCALGIPTKGSSLYYKAWVRSSKDKSESVSKVFGT